MGGDCSLLLGVFASRRRLGLWLLDGHPNLAMTFHYYGYWPFSVNIAGTVTRLVGDRAYGANTSLTAVFSAGVPWQITIVTYDMPTVAAATGTTAAFAIPATFRGDRVATMEAKYADGSNAGPQNWTSFKEYAYTYLPDYSAGTIALRPEFFAEVNDGAKVTLTLHFWSGAKVTYFVTKSGAR